MTNDEAADMRTSSGESSDADGPLSPDSDGPTSEVSIERALPVLLVALAGVAVVLALVMWFRASGAQGDLDEQRDAGRTAGEFAAAIIGYDFEDLDGSFDRVLALSSSDYESSLRDAYFTDLRPFVSETEAKGEVSVRQTFVEDVSGDEASAVVFFDAAIDSILGTRRLVGSYARVDLVREGGDWKVDDFAFLATTEEALDPSDQLGGLTPGGGDTPAAPTTTAPG